MSETDLYSQPNRESSIRPRPALLRALGSQEPPEFITADGVQWSRSETLKHDSWAATAIYEHDGMRLVCKMNRRQPVMGISMRWLGTILAQRESHFLTILAEIGHLPPPSGPVVVEGKQWKSAVARPYLPGHPLGKYERVGDNFFPMLIQRVREVHRQGMAYVDLHKRENVLVGEDGLPLLIDFQVCVRFPKWFMLVCPIAWIMLKALQRGDLYHLQKHVKRNRPDQWEALVSGREYQRPNWIQLHRLFAVPVRQLRRKLLTWMRVRKDGSALSELEPEDAVRREQSAKRLKDYVTKQIQSKAGAPGNEALALNRKSLFTNS